MYRLIVRSALALEDVVVRIQKTLSFVKHVFVGDGYTDITVPGGGWVDWTRLQLLNKKYNFNYL